MIQFALVPLTLNYLDKASYGIWLTLASFLEWFSFFDAGVGHGLRNRLAEALAVRDLQLAKIYVSTAYAFVTLLFVGFILLFVSINRLLDWELILNATNGGKLGDVAFYVVIFFCLRCIFSLLSVILYADQNPALNNLMGPLGSTLAYIGIYILTKSIPGSLFWAAFVLSAAPLIVLLVFTVILFWRKYRFIRPSIRSVKFGYAKDLLGLGMQFFIIQMSVLVIYSSDKIVLTQLFGPDEVTVYAIALKYFTIAMVINGIVTYTFWSPFTEAFAKKDFNWIRKTLKTLSYLSFASSLFVIASAFFADDLIRLWVGNSIMIPNKLKIAFSSFVIVNLLAAPYIMFINGVGKIRLQLYTSIISVLLTIPLAILFARALGFGPAGVIMAMICSILPNAILLRIQSAKIINGTANGIWNR